MSVLEAIEAREVSGGFGGDQCEVEGQAVLHERHLNTLDDRSSFFEHLDRQLLYVAVSVVKLLNVKLVENADAESFKETWGVDSVVSNPFHVTDPFQFCEVDAAGVVLVRTLHSICSKQTNQCK